MIQQLAIQAQQDVTLTDDLKAYVMKKIGHLDRYLPKHARESARGEVRLRQPNKKHGNKYECEVVLHLPDETITSSDTTMNVFAAIDIVEEKLKNQLKRYKDKMAERGRGEGFIGRFKRGDAGETEVMLDT